MVNRKQRIMFGEKCVLLLCVVIIFYNLSLMFSRERDLDRTLENILLIRRKYSEKVDSILSRTLFSRADQVIMTRITANVPSLQQRESNRRPSVLDRHLKASDLQDIFDSNLRELALDEVDQAHPHPDRKDNVSFITKNEESAHMVESRNSATPVLIVAYLRSGSSWVGDILYRSNTTFYVFEPFKPYQRQAYYTEGAICFNNNTCRSPNATSDRHSFAIFMLQQLLNCRLERLPAAMLRYLIHGSNTETKNMFFDCMQNRSNETKCFNYLKSICFRSRLRVVKTIRISMSLIENLLSFVPGLKIIHLLRDPRAMTNSRQKGYFSMSFDIHAHTKNLCSRMEEDLAIASKLKSKYPNQIFTVVYEALAEEPQTGIKSLYTFLEYNVTESFLQSVDIYSEGLKNNGYYKTHRRNPAYISKRWRMKLPFNTTEKIDGYCESLYAKVGFLKLKSEEEQHKLSYHSWTHMLRKNDKTWLI